MSVDALPGESLRSGQMGAVFSKGQRPAAASTHGVMLASWSRRVTTTSSPGRQVLAIARLSANVSVVMFDPKTISFGSVAPSRSAAATRAEPTSSQTERLVANAPPSFALQ